MDIRFDEEMVQTMWLRWVWLCKSKDNEKWKLATNRQKLAAFGALVREAEQQKEYGELKVNLRDMQKSNLLQQSL